MSITFLQMILCGWLSEKFLALMQCGCLGLILYQWQVITRYIWKHNFALLAINWCSRQLIKRSNNTYRRAPYIFKKISMEKHKWLKEDLYNITLHKPRRMHGRKPYIHLPLSEYITKLTLIESMLVVRKRTSSFYYIKDSAFLLNYYRVYCHKPKQNNVTMEAKIDMSTLTFFILEGFT